MGFPKARVASALHHLAYACAVSDLGLLFGLVRSQERVSGAYRGRALRHSADADDCSGSRIRAHARLLQQDREVDGRSSDGVIRRRR
jgi:hypothetical protein